MSANFRIAETEPALAALGEPRYRKLKSKLESYVYPQLRSNPFYGPNIKKLKGDFEDLWRYRVGKLRIFYSVEEKEKLVIIHEIEDRKGAYKRR